MSGVPYTQEEDDYILMIYKTNTYKRICKLLNQRFHTNRTPDSLAHHMRKQLGIKRVYTDYGYTDEEIIFLKENALYMTTKQLSDSLYKLYGRKHSSGAIKYYVREVLGFDREFMGRQGVVGYDLGAETVYRGETYVKVNNTGKPYTDWQLKSHYIWERANKKGIPDGYIVKFIDGDRMNFDPSNLICVSRNTAMEITRNDWDNGNPVFLKTIEKYGEMKDLMRKGEKQNDN